MKAVVVGNGLAGTMAARFLRERRPDASVRLLAEEPYPYYPRPNLIDYLAGTLLYDKVFAFPRDWGERLGIQTSPAVAATAIRRISKVVETSRGEAVPYDVLLLASGGRAAVPPIPGADRAGVFVLRTLDDAAAMLAWIEGHHRVAVVGGGLLGIEVARALRARGAGVEIVEVFDRLLPRQLDERGAGILRAQIEASGVRVRLGARTAEIAGAREATGLRFADGSSAAADMVVIAAGVAPRVELAADAGLTVDRGVVVDDFLRTSDPSIYAAGDVVSHHGRVYGIIPAAFEQARIAAHNMASGPEKTYLGTVPANTLKVAGLYVSSAGEFLGEGPDIEVLTAESPESGVYKKIVLREGRLRGAIWMGSKKGAAEVARLVASGAITKECARGILEDGFDFSSLEDR